MTPRAPHKPIIAYLFEGAWWAAYRTYCSIGRLAAYLERVRAAELSNVSRETPQQTSGGCS